MKRPEEFGKRERLEPVYSLEDVAALVGWWTPELVAGWTLKGLRKGATPKERIQLHEWSADAEGRPRGRLHRDWHYTPEAVMAFLDESRFARVAAGE